QQSDTIISYNAMEFNPVHIHKTKHGSFGKLLMLTVPIMVYILILTYFTFAKSKSSIKTQTLGTQSVLNP
ncbi:MAG: hypothetical protein AAB622_02390, partial [Patescibacteria group bacterium]